jgi:ATP-dependent RNA helicase DOB1
VSVPQKKSIGLIVAFRAVKGDRDALAPPRAPGAGQGYLVRVDIDDISDISTLNFESSGDLLQPMIMAANLERLERAIAAGPTVVSEREFIKDGADQYEALLRRFRELDRMLERCPAVPDAAIAAYRENERSRKQCLELETELYSLRNAVMLQDLAAMIKVLERIGFVAPDGIVVEKGRAAAVITSGNELVLTEILYGGIFKNLTPQQIAALVSAFASDEEAAGEPRIPPDVAENWAEMQDIEARVAEVVKECGVEKTVEEWARKMDPTYIMVAYNWAGGADLASLIEENQELFEGTIIRTLRRTEEVLRQAARAAKEMGECALEVAILSAIALIKRDVVFVASLYV